MAEVGLFSSPNTSFELFTKTTISSSTFRMSSVFFRVLVSLWTMSFSSIFSRKSMTTKAILSWGNYFKMIRVYTISYSAKMVELKSLWNWFNKIFIVPTVCHSSFTMAYGKPSVALFSKISTPHPTVARTFNNNSKEAFFSSKKPMWVSVKRFQLAHTAMITRKGETYYE